MNKSDTGTDDQMQSADIADALAAQSRQQTQLMNQWVQGVMADRQSERRAKTFRRLLGYSLLAGVAIFYALLLSGSLSVFGGGKTQKTPHVAVVKVEGQISYDSPASADNIITALRSAWQAPNAEAVLIRINSPGGSPVQSQRIYHEILRLKSESLTNKPVYAVIEDIGASGAYYVAAAADEIRVSPSSLVGSIGVIQSSFGAKDAMESLGIERRVFTAGDNKAFLDPFRDVTEDQVDFWQGVLNTVHQQFIADVKAGRGDRLKDDKDVFSGLIWSGEQAVAMGLADSIGDSSQISRELFDGEHRLVDYTPSQPLFQRVVRQIGVVAMDLMNVSHSETGLMMR
ncbi:signal peptide peptidase SppA [Vreelandella rituensis]|uniref:Signal peptide peptidase SppA n=1 Tax=Vreelandella rituensis TaxID=2282306 RepID=A0A368U9A7_9GAMM|nr:signal peptide peptidase SppA [Halomonas rituensis]RCV93799.1 signal peptide peptidase SppA [Halomonas rituensis]